MQPPAAAMFLSPATCLSAGCACRLPCWHYSDVSVMPADRVLALFKYCCAGTVNMSQ